MRRLAAAVLAAVSCAVVAQAHTIPVQSAQAAVGGGFTLEQALAMAGASAPAADAAEAGVEAARAARKVAALRPNPTLDTEVENIAGTGPYRGFDSVETTVSLSVPVELGGKRQARIGVADAEANRARLGLAIAEADIRLQVTELYVAAVAAEERLAIARDQRDIAESGAKAAAARVEAGRASPIEAQRANVARLNAAADLERAERNAATARESLARRIGQQVAGVLDAQRLRQLPAPSYGPAKPAEAAGTLAFAAADAVLAVADASVAVARSQRMPDITVGPGVRRITESDDTAFLFSVSVPLPTFNSGKAALSQARAERSRAEAERRMAVIDAEQAIADADAEAANAATTARTATGPALAAAQEAARIARIGYREGKFGQLDLLDAERTLAETRLTAIDALAAYQTAKARLERLTAPAPQQGY